MSTIELGVRRTAGRIGLTATLVALAAFGACSNDYDQFQVATGAGGASGSSSGGTGSSTSSGGQGGGGGCAAPKDCPAPAECKVATCTAGACGTDNAPDGTPSGAQTAGDCKKVVCTGGAASTVNDDTDINDDKESCTTDTCNAGTPVHTPVADATPCNDNGGATCANGVCVGCASPADCPAPAECSVATCTANACGTANAPAGTPAAAQTAGDCQTILCDGSGGKTTQPDDTDVPNDNESCTIDACNAGVPSHTPVAEETVCSENGGAVCHTGACVACIITADCKDVAKICQANLCVAGGCINGVKDGSETDVDCGGSCGPCADGKKCLVAADCTSDVCNAGLLTCTPPTCTDTVKNGSETDVDCGGAVCDGQSKKCGYNKGCLVAADCLGAICSASKCAASCTDTVKNGSETDVDCGGAVCGGCTDGKLCTANGDCSSNFCLAGTCHANLCVGVMCTAKDQCHTAGVCDMATGMCTNPNQPNGTACNDANACTTGDVCTSGTCAGPGTLSCDDSKVCTTDSCVPATGCAHANNTLACDDLNACTTGDVCAGGTCAGLGTLSCDDSKVCTTDSCVPATGCAHANNTLACDDLNACTTGDVCGGGTCAGPVTLSCDDSNVCTTDSCVPATGCAHAPNALACAVANGTGLCAAGACTVASCSAPFGNCDGNAGNGCETNTNTNTANCGACSRPCSGTNVLSQNCTAGLCDSTCDLGWGNCTKPIAPAVDNGCELAVSATAATCGSCANSCALQGDVSGSGPFVCDGAARPKNICGCSTNGQCSLPGAGNAICSGTGLCTCNGSLVACNPSEACNASNLCTCNGGAACAAGSTCCQTPAGCQNLQTSAASCGACGHACPTGFSCAAGACQCTMDVQCNAGTGGTCGGGVCHCGAPAVPCAVGERCLPSGVCG